MSHESLDLLLVVDVPDSQDPIFSSTDKVLPIGGQAQRLIPVSLNSSIVLLTLE
jgi:hypothetical protein